MIRRSATRLPWSKRRCQMRCRSCHRSWIKCGRRLHPSNLNIQASIFNISLHPFMLDLLPPEIFGRVLEIATEAWGVGFLSTICLVSSACYGVVVSTPSLWGIIVVDKNRSISLMNQQLAKAKETDLRITFTRKGWHSGHKNTRHFTANLAALAHNWVRVDMPTNVISLTRWTDMRRMEALSLRFHGGGESSAENFFAESESSSETYTRSSLHSFAASGLPEEWMTRFLGPSITYLEIARLDRGVPASTIQQYLSLVPNVHTLSLPVIYFLPLSASPVVVLLSHLHNLELTRVHDLTPLLLHVRAPALRTLSIRDCTGQMGPVFSQWSQAGFLPAGLQSLELSNSLSSDDFPFFIGWLSRLPALLRLTISQDDEVWNVPTWNVLTPALAAPDGAGPVVDGWLCPSLIHLCLDIPLRLADILPIARARSGGPGTPPKLRSMQAQLCSSGTAEEIAEFRSYFTEPEDARCLCLGCSFNLTI
ncbi:hypothetical protein C8F04DRAFT_559453 [Mycena alexandri]|uniref:Uncharacterized protein n=1 Tax=Mycena alexandri TaxID=1745969 RepID=A0AAD6X3Y9_9AGAR|nr:hypothetical protein C8F04DRAFT_559453 [Mycena alexandri]